MSSTLELSNITMDNKGMYHCKAELEPTKYLNAAAKVLIYGEQWWSDQMILQS